MKKKKAISKRGNLLFPYYYYMKFYDEFFHRGAKIGDFFKIFLIFFLYIGTSFVLKIWSHVFLFYGLPMNVCVIDLQKMKKRNL